MASLCEGGNEPPDSLKVICKLKTSHHCYTHPILEVRPWMGGVKADQATRPDELCLSYNVSSATSKPAKTYEMLKPDLARAILAPGTNFTAK
ncbi:hypothetical protein ANN_07527 [Periplaneta americana]|uniref:Uncharacterized protein n=1 Tax=Periplaneta americana TaxID=6978 RepID=A0ABQ8SZI5_PERAM|nr:hypothetical protein ANN_07527 [Periplaneta americana]